MAGTVGDQGHLRITAAAVDTQRARRQVGYGVAVVHRRQGSRAAGKRRAGSSTGDVGGKITSFPTKGKTKGEVQEIGRFIFRAADHVEQFAAAVHEALDHGPYAGAQHDGADAFGRFGNDQGIGAGQGCAPATGVGTGESVHRVAAGQQVLLQGVAFAATVCTHLNAGCVGKKGDGLRLDGAQGGEQHQAKNG